ncbi:polysaccharide biosynthesis/export family protein [Paracoccus sp. (in: a-proteobacteria)]|uniref:polysaccharide biosynthesis/export family protein n=1 Tax=Paracoccus sp. TaxID=267 RepID=UPI003A858F80
MAFRDISIAFHAIALIALAACAGGHTPDNHEPVAKGGGYQAQYRDFSRRSKDKLTLLSERMNAQNCLPFGGNGGGGKYAGRAPAALRGELLSRGDLLDLRVPDDDTFTGQFEISRDGTLKLPFISPIAAQGRSTDQVVADIREALVSGGYYVLEPEISLLVMDFSSARVGVNGAVFEPQTVEIGRVSADDRDDLRQAARGGSTEGRNLSVALRNAGGVRPDADLSAVRLTRGGTNYVIDLRGAIEGRSFDDVMLLTGDEINVPSRQCFQDDLMQPSPISPPGVSLYMSNLTLPADSNAGSAIGQTVREVPYGTRYMQAVIDANCVGGARATSADRSAALFSRNPMTGVSAVIERRVEEMRMRPDRDDYDPYLLPGDAIACYDSDVTNLDEAARVFGVVAAGVMLVR